MEIDTVLTTVCWESREGNNFLQFETVLVLVFDPIPTHLLCVMIKTNGTSLVK